MIMVLVALRDFFVAVLISWLGVASEPADKSHEQAEPAAKPVTTAVLAH